ncbi:MAG: hypothetical protein NT038_01880 [Euryarchaeota archaeon]|nr:hypothetical protein [Euryarchaeota archaeon]
MVERTCEKCKHIIDLNEHKSGLVFEDKMFICEPCSNHTPEQEIKELSQSVMHRSGTGIPIALWLVHEQNKDKRMFSKKK